MRRAFAEQRERRSDISTDAQKYKPGLDPLEKEAALTVIQDRGELENKKIRKILQKMIDGAKTEAERNALLMWKSHLRADQISGLIQKEFVRDFWAWLLGRGKEADHAKTPWYRQSLTHDDEIAAYCDSFVIKMQEFRLKLAKLGLRVPKGINQAFLFFKFIVRGEDPNSASFLHDWQLLSQDEFNKARETGQRERNLDPIGRVYDGQHNHHEMAPYGGEEKKKAAEARDVRLEEEIADDISVSGDEKTEDDSDDNIPMDIDADTDVILAKDLQNQGSRDAQVLAAEKIGRVAQEKISKQEEKISELEKKIAAMELAKQPADESKALVAQAKEKQELYRELAEKSQKHAESLVAQLNADRLAREKETRDLIDMMKMHFAAVPTLEGKGKEEMDVQLHPDVEKSIKFQENFMKQFTDYVGNMERRQAELMNFLSRNQQAPSSPLIEEVQEMAKQTDKAVKALESLPANLALSWKSALEAQDTKISALAIALAPDTNNSIEEWKQAREEDNKRFHETLKNFAAFMREMQGAERQSIDKLMREHDKRIADMMLKLPQQNQTLMIELKKELEESFEKQLAIRSQPVQSELAEAIAMMQHSSNEASEFYAAMNAAAQRAAQAEDLLRQAQQRSAEIQAQNEQKMLFLRNQAEQAARQAQLASQQAFQAQQQNQMTNQRIGWAMQQNQGMQQALQAAEQRHAQQMQMFYQSTQGLINRIGYLQREAAVPETNEPFSAEEKWVLRLEGGTPPMLLEGPKGANSKAEYKMPTYSEATLAKIKSPQQKELVDQVRDLENRIVALANKNGVLLDPELAHNLNVESVHPKVLATKLARYQAALENWGK